MSGRLIITVEALAFLPRLTVGKIEWEKNVPYPAEDNLKNFKRPLKAYLDKIWGWKMTISYISAPFLYKKINLKWLKKCFNFFFKLINAVTEVSCISVWILSAYWPRYNEKSHFLLNSNDDVHIHCHTPLCARREVAAGFY